NTNHGAVAEFPSSQTPACVGSQRYLHHWSTHTRNIIAILIDGRHEHGILLPWHDIRRLLGDDAPVDVGAKIQPFQSTWPPRRGDTWDARKHFPPLLDINQCTISATRNPTWRWLNPLAHPIV